MPNKLPTPEEFLKARFLPQLEKDHIKESFRNELKWLHEYGMIVGDFKDEQMKEVVSKVNFLISACIREDKKAIDEFICQFGKIENEPDRVTLDWEKILNEK